MSSKPARKSTDEQCAAPALMDSWFGCSLPLERLLFVQDRAAVAQLRVPPYRLMEALDVVEDSMVAMQEDTGIGSGLSAARFGGMIPTQGAATQNNLHGYRCLQMPDTPEMEVDIAPSTNASSGVGERRLPPLAPAVAFALFHLTGKRGRSLPQA